jgi:hypothetical protein
MRKVTGSQLLWIAGAGSLALAAVVGGCSSKSSSNTTTNEDGGEEDGGSSSSGAGSSGGSSGAGSSSSSSGAGSSSSGSSGGVAEASTGDGAVEAASSSGGTEAGATEAGASDGGDAGCTTLKLYNFDTWCSVSINGAATSTSGTQSVCVTPGTISLVAEPNGDNFELGPDPWVYISGTGGTDSGISGTIVGDGGVGSTSTTSVNVVAGAPGCVLVCCPFSSNGTGCTTSESGYTTFLANCP